MINRLKLDLEAKHIEGTDFPLITLRGTLDIYTAQELRKTMERYLANPDQRRIILDVEGVEHIDSSGIGVLFAASIRLKKRDGALYLIKPQEMVQMVLRITKAIGQMVVCDSFDDTMQKLTESRVSPV